MDHPPNFRRYRSIPLEVLVELFERVDVNDGSIGPNSRCIVLLFIYTIKLSFECVIFSYIFVDPLNKHTNGNVTRSRIILIVGCNLFSAFNLYMYYGTIAL